VSRGGWKLFVGQWGAFKCGMGAYGGKNRKYVFLAIFGHKWVAMVAHRVTVGGHGVEGNMGYVMGYLGTFFWPMGHIKV
jgi:hypothetical protein